MLRRDEVLVPAVVPLVQQEHGVHEAGRGPAALLVRLQLGHTVGGTADGVLVLAVGAGADDPVVFAGVRVLPDGAGTHHEEDEEAEGEPEVPVGKLRSGGRLSDRVSSGRLANTFHPSRTPPTATSPLPRPPTPPPNPPRPPPSQTDSRAGRPDNHGGVGKGRGREERGNVTLVVDDLGLVGRHHGLLGVEWWWVWANVAQPQPSQTPRLASIHSFSVLRFLVLTSCC